MDDITGDVYRNPHWLRSRYNDDGKAVPEIADECGVSRRTIRKWMDRYGIETTGKGPTPDNTDYRDADWLSFMYHERGHTVEEIADRCDVAISTISRWLDKHGIETREKGAHTMDINPMSDPQVVEDHPIAGLKGENHPQYIGEDGAWRSRSKWTELREMAIQRDGERCILCGLTREEHHEHVGQDLDVHHIVPTSEGGRKYAPENLATLCRACHKETHNALNTVNEPTAEQDWITPEKARYA